jgi:hypothetical protein
MAWCRGLQRGPPPAAVLGRLPPAPYPLDTEAGTPYHGRRGQRQRGGPSGRGRAGGGGRGGARRGDGRRLRPPWAVATWSAAAVLDGYRAQWHGARGCQTRPPRRRLTPIRRPPPTPGAAPVRALRVAWALPAGTTTRLRTLWRAPATTARAVGRSGRLSGLGWDRWRQQVPGIWSAARVQACLPRWRRFLGRRPRRRGQQEAAVRAW